MKTNWFKIASALSLLVTATLMTGCGAGDMDGPAGAEDAVLEDDLELGSIGQALQSCATPDGTNAVMAALAVAAGHELGRWRAGLDFGFANSKVVLLSGTGSDGKPRGSSRCSGGVCPQIAALLAMQSDNATNVYLQVPSSNTTVRLDPWVLRGRMSAKLGEQINKDRDAKDGDLYQVPKTAHKLTGLGSASLGGCGPHYKFQVAFDASTTTPKPLPAQLKTTLLFADHTNGWVDFRDLGNNVVAIDPTYGLNSEDTTSTGSCMAACTKISTTSIVGACCSCGGVTKTFKRAVFSSSVYLCQ